MPEITVDLKLKILSTLAAKDSQSFSLEELTQIVFPAGTEGSVNRSELNLRQSKVLEILIFLADLNLIYLDSQTDRSSIKKSNVN
jgi:hypothetical protein